MHAAHYIKKQYIISFYWPNKHFYTGNLLSHIGYLPKNIIIILMVNLHIVCAQIIVHY